MIKTARDVNKAPELVNTIPMFGFFNDIVDVAIADRDPINISVKIKILSFLLNFYIFFHSILYQF